MSIRARGALLIAVCVVVAVTVAAPTGFTATNVSGDVAPSWSALHGAPASEYNIGRSTASGQETTDIATVAAPTMTYADDSAIGDVTGYYEVQAANDFRVGPFSNEALAAPGEVSQTILFTSPNPSPVTVGGAAYTPAATATSGLTVTITLDDSSTANACSISNGVVSFTGVGTCIVDANQAGNPDYSAATQIQQAITVGEGSQAKASQTILFTSPNPSPVTVGGATYTPTATATSGLTVTITLDHSSTVNACSNPSGVVNFTGVGTCVIDANQAGNANYLAAPQVQQTIAVGQASAVILVPGARLSAGQSITSPNDEYSLTMQGDGNLVEYTAAAAVVWAAGTNPSGSDVVMQGDGNLVVYNASAVALWASNTSGNPGAYLVLGDDGDLVVDSASGEPLWAETGILVPGAKLSAGQSITSPNGAYHLSMQADGNLVEYTAAAAVVWAAGTNPSGSEVIMQGDGNLVVYNGSAVALWASNTSGNPGAYLVLGDDGDLVVDSASGEPLWAETGILVPGARLSAGQSITSPNGEYHLSMQADGNLVEYTAAAAVVWASSTNPSGSYVVMQGDGNLVVYNASAVALWASNTSGNPGAYLVLGDDGDLVVDSASGEPLWAETGILVPGAKLSAGQSITSPNGAYHLSMQADGNLVEYTAAAAVVWAAGTNPSGSEVIMQGDGNLVVYNGSAVALWASNTSGNPGAYLVLGDDGDLVVDSASGEPLWAETGILVPGPWTLKFDSEFNGSSLDTSQWSTGWFGSGITPPVNSAEEDCYDPAQVSVANGELDLTAIAKAEECGGITEPYASGIVTTNGLYSFTYGYMEARIWLPGSVEIDDWPAFWADGQNFPTDGEIDILEGRNGSACAHFHNSAGALGACVSGNFTGGWHTFAADWEPGSITYYYDGTEIWQDTTGITSVPMYLILNLALDGSPSNTVPATMRVDYVRVWQH